MYRRQTEALQSACCRTSMGCSLVKACRLREQPRMWGSMISRPRPRWSLRPKSSGLNCGRSSVADALPFWKNLRVLTSLSCFCWHGCAASDVFEGTLRTTAEVCLDSLRKRNAVIKSGRVTRARTGQQNQGSTETRNYSLNSLSLNI